MHAIRSLAAVLILIASITLSGFATGDQPVPRLIRYSGILRTTDGQPRTGTVGVTFSIYADEHGSSPLFIETHSLSLDEHGAYVALIGSEHVGGLAADLFADGEPRWLAVQVESEPEDANRVLLVSVPYAYRAADAETLGGKPASAYLLAPTDGTAGTSVKTVSNALSASLPLNALNGATNAIAKFVDATTLGNSTMLESALGVGVGTTNPTQRLDVAGRMLLRGTPAAGPGLMLGDDAGASSVLIGQYANQTASPLGFWHSGKLAMSLDSSGRVGVGIPYPYERFEVAGRAKLRADGDTTGGFWLTGADGNGQLFVGQAGASSYDPFGVWHSGRWRFTVGANGNVGVGVDRPYEKFEVAGRAKYRTDGANTAGFWLTGPEGNGSLFVGQAGTTSSDPFGVFHAGAWRFVVTAAGTLGVGTMNPSAQLEVVRPANASSAAAIYAHDDATTELSYGVRSETASDTGVAVHGVALAKSGTATGIYGRTNAPDGTAINGEAYSSTGRSYGVHGITRSPQGMALAGDAVATGGTSYGVYGSTAGDGYSAGVYGLATSQMATASTYGVYGKAASAKGIGAIGYASSMTGYTSGIYGMVESGTGTAGEFNNFAGGTVLLGRSAGMKVFRVDGYGKVFANGGTQVGGADFAESVAVLGARESYAPGDVLVIDATGDRRFALASETYATNVAGIYSTKPGVLGTPHTLDSAEIAQEVPLAMIGIVPCKASAENGAIRRGDLLVTSATPGHVMRGTDRSRLLGAIVGKALQPLSAGIGVIECMVTLQ
ncbi:MAG TPA: hypothetical protein VN622_10635 [Clostridia bacterium]|nr:hypothetical protein [Clostridia bacterium]